MKNYLMAKKLVRIAGLLLGPGIPDGTGPRRNLPICPYNRRDEGIIKIEKHENYLEEYKKGIYTVVIEQEDDEIEVELYRGDKVIFERYFSNLEEAQILFDKLVKKISQR